MTTPGSGTQNFGIQQAGTRSFVTFGFVKRAVGLASLALLLLPLPGCQSITGSAAIAEARIIDASPDAPGLDVYQGSNVLAYNLGLGTITSYITFAPGTYGIVVDGAGTRQQLVSAQGTFLNGGQYTVLIGNFLNGLQELILRDQSTPAPSGQINVRFIDQSTRAGALDLYLVPSGSTIIQVKPVLTNVTFDINTGYFSVPAGAYTLVALPAGTVPTAMGTTAYTGASVTYQGGAARTFVLIDQQLLTTPGIQVVTGDDYDSPGATS
jgi:hypothetical protein